MVDINADLNSTTGAPLRNAGSSSAADTSARPRKTPPARVSAPEPAFGPVPAPPFEPGPAIGPGPAVEPLASSLFEKEAWPRIMKLPSASQLSNEPASELVSRSNWPGSARRVSASSRTRA